MAEDLYTSWLGVPPGPRPPDYYALLGVPRFCRKPETIEAAAREKLARLDKMSLHPDKAKRDLCTRVMNEVAQARVTLADPLRRSDYEHLLARQIGIEAPAPGGDATGDEFDRLQAEMSHSEPIPAGAVTLTATQAQERKKAPVLWIVGATAGVILLAVIGWAIMNALQPAHTNTVTTGTDGATVGTAPNGSNSAANTPPDGGTPTTTGTTNPSTTTPVTNPTTGTGSTTPKPTGTGSTTPKPTGAGGKSVPGATSPDWEDSFDGATLGSVFRVRSVDGQGVSVGGSAMHIAAQDSGPVRVDVTPRGGRQAFREVTMRAILEPGTDLEVGVATADTLRIKHTPQGIQISTKLGNVIGEQADRGYIVLPNAGGSDAPFEVELRMQRRFSKVAWELRGTGVAISTDVMPLGDFTWVLVVNGPPGKRVSVDAIRVWYEK